MIIVHIHVNSILESGNNLENLNQKVGSPITTDLPSPNEKVPISKGALLITVVLSRNLLSPNKEEGEKLMTGGKVC